MTQPTFDDGPPVPLMVEGVIDRATLAQLATDLTAHATVVGVRAKGGVQAYADATELSLDTAVAQLAAGSVRAIQVRYRYDGFEWSDTILATPTGFRVVRARQD